MLILLAAHGLVAAVLPGLVRRWGSPAFLVGALPPLAALGYVLAQQPRVLAGRDATESVSWVPGLGIELALRLDALSAAAALLVSGVGVVVMVYSVGYFAGQRPVRTATALLGFAGAMLGLVLADDLLALYVFWELTTICSFVLIGHDETEEDARRSAAQALLTTTAAGLLMLLGFVVLGESAGTYSISALLADPPAGPAVTAALVCVLIGAFAKSALVPFHGWLPAAMIAPTPVSAYLHAAAMVNAGVYLIGRLAPAFADNAAWRPLVLTVGAATMLLGAWRALRQTDLKRLLAFSTVSQLGFVTVLLGAGSRTAALAGVGLLLAHGMAKAALFLVVGAVERETGTRDITELSGLGRRQPWLWVPAVLAAASLAGLPPLLGYVAKESAYEAFAHGGAGELVVLGALVAGSALTAAYALRLLQGAFGGGGDGSGGDGSGEPGRASTPWTLAGLVLPLAAGGLLLGLAAPVVDALAAAWAGRLPVAPGGDPQHHLKLWHGLTLTLGLSALSLLIGGLLHAGRRGLARAQDGLGAALPAALDVDRGYRAALTGLHHGALVITARVQAGSPPVYLLVVALTVLALPGSALLVAAIQGSAGPGPRLQLWSSPAEAVLGALVLAGALAASMHRRRLAIVLVLGFVGYGVAGLFVLRGAPDLALTQLLVETLSLVAFVLVLRRIPEAGLRPQTRSRRAVRRTVATTLGVFVAVLALVATGARSAPPVSEQIRARAESEAGGRNVVTTILVDFRALDTIGEASVVLVAIIGLASLVLVTRRRASSREGPAYRDDEAERRDKVTAP